MANAASVQGSLYSIDILDKEQKGEDAPDGFSNVIEIKGDDAKKIMTFMQRKS